MHLYLDKDNYITGYGSDPQEGSVELQELPDEVGNDFISYKFLNGEFVFDKDKKQSVLDKLTLEREAAEINTWFTWYDSQCMQYQRAERANQPFNHDMTELDKTACEKQQRLKEISGILEN